MNRLPVVAACAALFTLATAATAQTYPVKPIRVIVAQQASGVPFQTHLFAVILLYCNA
jgi:hypothetical protein